MPTQEQKDALIAAWADIGTACADLAAGFTAFETARGDAGLPNMSPRRTAGYVQGAMLNNAVNNAGLDWVLKGSPTADWIGKRKRADRLAADLEALEVL